VNGITYSVRWLPPAKMAARLAKQRGVKELKNVPAERAIAVVADGMKGLAEGAHEECKAILNETASRVQGEALEAVPGALGALKQSIGIRVGEDGPYSREVYAGGPPAPYAPFIEYGTSTGAPPIEEIVAWMNAKGITPRDPDDSVEDAAFKIRRSIMGRGIRAQPFLFPAFERARQGFLDQLRKVFG